MKIKSLHRPEASGKFSNNHYVSYYPQLGVSVIKKNPHKRTAHEWSKNQQENRSRFAAMVQFARLNKYSLIHPIWKLHSIEKLTGYHLFVHMNKRAFNMQGELSSPDLLYATVGSLPIARDMHIDLLDKENTLEISWEKQKRSIISRKFDLLGYVVFRSDRCMIPYYTNAYRVDSHAVIKTEIDVHKGDTIYLFFTTQDRKSYSTSQSFIL